MRERTETLLLCSGRITGRLAFYFMAFSMFLLHGCAGFSKLATPVEYPNLGSNDQSVLEIGGKEIVKPSAFDAYFTAGNAASTDQLRQIGATASADGAVLEFKGSYSKNQKIVIKNPRIVTASKLSFLDLPGAFSGKQPREGKWNNLATSVIIAESYNLMKVEVGAADVKVKKVVKGAAGISFKDSLSQSGSNLIVGTKKESARLRRTGFRSIRLRPGGALGGDPTSAQIIYRSRDAHNIQINFGAMPAGTRFAYSGDPVLKPFQNGADFGANNAGGFFIFVRDGLATSGASQVSLYEYVYAVSTGNGDEIEIFDTKYELQVK